MRLTTLLALIFFATTAFAQEAAEVAPEEVTVGEVRLALSSDYPRILLNDDSWEEHEYLDAGKTLVLHKIDRNQEHVLVLTPIYKTLAPATVTVLPADWKLVTIKKGLKMWRFEGKVTFDKALKEVPKPAPIPTQTPPPPVQPEPLLTP